MHEELRLASNLLEGGVHVLFIVLTLGDQQMLVQWMSEPSRGEVTCSRSYKLCKTWYLPHSCHILLTT